MRKPLVISVLLHGLILLFALVTFPTFGDKLPVQPTPLPVDLVTPAELTKIKAGARKAKVEESKADKKPEPPVKKEAEKPTPKKVEAAKAPEPKPSKVKTVKAPEPKPEKAEAAPKVEKEKKTAEDAPAPLPQRKPKPVKVVEKKPEPEKVVKKAAPAKEVKKDFDPDKIAALLNKAPDTGPKTVAATPDDNKPEAAQGRSDGKDLQMTFNEIDALRAKISQCWNPPVGGLGADAIQVKLRLKLTEAGSLTNTPEVVNRAGSPFFQAAADAAVRAVMLCQPYQLPPRKYALWRDMILNFDPREMFGG